MDRRVRLKELSGLRRGDPRISGELGTLWEGGTFASSLAFTTGVDVRSGGMFSSASLAAVVGVGRDHFEHVVLANSDAPVGRNGRVFYGYVGSVSTWWGEYKDAQHKRLIDIAHEQQPRATDAAKRAAFNRRVIPLDSY